MSDFWDLFAETGDIGFYLLYLESSGKELGPEKGEPAIAGSDNGV